MKFEERPIALGFTGAGRLATRDDEVVGVRLNAELRLVRGLAVTARLGLRTLVPMRVGLLGLAAAVEVLRPGEVTLPVVDLLLLPPERANGRGVSIPLLVLPLTLILLGFEESAPVRCFAILRPLFLSSSDLSPLAFGFSPSVVSGLAVLLTCCRLVGFSPGFASGGDGTVGR